MKEIKLLTGQVVLVDDKDFDSLNQYKWRYHARFVLRYRYSDGRQTIVFLHREIIKPAKGMQVDHIDGNRLNNQRHNLRECTHAENQRNRKKHKNNTSGYKGVDFSKKNHRFRAKIKLNYKSIHLGYFNTALEAAYVYNKAAKELHKEFACLNPI